MDGETLGRDWDVEGDPAASHAGRPLGVRRRDRRRLHRADGGRGVPGTAPDWTDLRRIAGLVGYRPRPPRRRAGLGRASRSTRAPTRCRRPARASRRPGRPARRRRPSRSPQDTQLRSDWDGLTATWVPGRRAAGRAGRVRFLGDPGLPRRRPRPVRARGRAGEPVRAARLGIGVDSATSGRMLELDRCCLLRGHARGASRSRSPTVVGRVDELGTTLVEFDRDLDGLLADPRPRPYAAYRVLATAGQARRLDEGRSRVRATVAVSTVDVTSDRTRRRSAPRTTSRDRSSTPRSRTSPRGQTVADRRLGVRRAATSSRCRRTRRSRWEVAPGTPTRVSQLDVRRPRWRRCDHGARRTAAAHGRTSSTAAWSRATTSSPTVATGATASQLRLYPRAEASTRARRGRDDRRAATPTWEVLACRDAAARRPGRRRRPHPAVGLIVDLVDGAPAG